MSDCINRGVLNSDGSIFCPACDESFIDGHFIKKVRQSGKIVYYCSKFYNRNTKDRAWKSKLKTFFKVDSSFYDNLLKEQNDCCGICTKHQSCFNRRLSIDHNHDNGRIRGLLCHNCNNGIGLLKESTVLIIRAIHYLNNSKVEIEKDLINKKYTTKELEYYADKSLRKIYGINYQDYLNILKSQNNCCAICQLSRDDYHKNFAVDHCHKEGYIRGVLCNSCNVGIAAFNDNPALLEKAIAYILKYNN